MPRHPRTPHDQRLGAILVFELAADLDHAREGLLAARRLGNRHLQWTLASEPINQRHLAQIAHVARDRERADLVLLQGAAERVREVHVVRTHRHVLLHGPRLPHDRCLDDERSRCLTASQDAVAVQQVAPGETRVASLPGRAVSVCGRAEVHPHRVGCCGGSPAGPT